tara:strand:- start:6767 stop:7048 length:282 start_codon:yes stop_codon:yes gene_type:complete
MPRLLSVKINLDKVDKEKLYKGKKGSYLDVDLWVNDEPDQYGYDATAIQNQSKEDREAGLSKNYIGNAKKMFGWGTSTPSGENVDLHSSAEPF